MPLEGEYEPSPWAWVREQVAEYEASNGERANTLLDTNLPVVIVTMRGRKSGKIRKVPLMRVEHEGEYALVASIGGAPANPSWYGNLVADPTVMIQDGAAPHEFVVRRSMATSASCGGPALSPLIQATPTTRRKRADSSRCSWPPDLTPRGADARDGERDARCLAAIS